MENMHTDVRVLRVKTFYAIMSLTVSSGRFSPFCSRHATQDQKKKLTLLTRNHAQYLDLFSFLSDCHFLLKCLLIFLQVVSQVWSVVGMQIPFGRNYWSRLVLLPRYKRVRTPPICWSPRRYSPVIETQPSKAIKGNKMYPHKNYTFFVIVSVVPL